MHMQDLFEIEENGAGAIVTVLIGSLSLTNIAHVKREYSELDLEGKAFVVLNLVKLKYMDSAAIGWLMSIFKQYKQKGSPFIIVNNNENINEIFAITHIDKILNIMPNLDQAIQQVANG